MTLFKKLAGKASALLNASGICSNNCIDGHCSGCGECCADLLPLTKGEIKRLRDYARKHHLQKAWINGEKHGKRANMSGAYLFWVYLFWVYMSGANMSGAENVPYTPMECPDEGEFTGWKNAETIES